MSAQQASESANLKNLSFAGVLNQVLEKSGHEITWASPSVYMTEETLNKYDLVLVGVSPITSVGANRVYGALSVISKMWGKDKLKLFVDCPNQSQIDISLRSVISNPDSLVKPFFSYRKEYSNVVSDSEIQSEITNGIGLLIEEEWPVTIVPSLPWNRFEDIKLSKNAKSKLELINLDSHLLLEEPISSPRTQKWCVDSLASRWSKSVVSTVLLPNSPMKWNKGWGDEQVILQISRSIGAIISPDQKDGTWWSYRYIQAMNSNTPVVTDWTESQNLSADWSVLASAIDSMSEEKRDLLATAQREIYLASIKGKKASSNALESILGVK